MQVLLLLVLATFLDHITGPNVSAAAFYIFPVGLAGWRLGGKIAAVVVAIAAALNATTIWFEANIDGFTFDLLASQMLHCIVYSGVAFLTTRLRQGRQLVEAQRDHIDGLRQQMAQEMQAARRFQEILVKPPPYHPSVEIGTFMAAARILGGDILNVSLSPNSDRLAVLVADVSGKGPSAALATAVLLGILQDCPARLGSPARTLAFLNKRLEDCLPDSMFVTALYLVIDLKTGALTWASAGHEPPLLLCATDGSVSPNSVPEIIGENDAAALPLAILGDTIYEDRALSLSPGDVLLCYTDGLTDMRLPSGGRLGSERLSDLLRRFASLPCPRMISSILQEPTGICKEAMSGRGWTTISRSSPSEPPPLFGQQSLRDT